METEVIKDCECYEQREGYRESGRKKGKSGREWEKRTKGTKMEEGMGRETTGRGWEKRWQ